MKRRTLFFAPLAAALGACGFEPLHASRASGRPGGLPEIRVEPISDRSGQLLRGYLLDRLAPTGERRGADHVLEIKLFEPRQTLALRRDDVISRLSYTVVANFELRGPAGRSLLSGSSTFSTDYEVTNSEFATLAALQNARERLLEMVSDDIRNQIVAGLRDRQ